MGMCFEMQDCEREQDKRHDGGVPQGGAVGEADVIHGGGGEKRRQFGPWFSHHASCGAVPWGTAGACGPKALLENQDEVNSGSFETGYRGSDEGGLPLCL